MRAICIMSYNRPEYLQQVLLSLRQSLEFCSEKLDIYLFQDGTFNIYSQTQKTFDYLAKENVKLFEDIFPNGRSMVSPVNLGVALNFDRAERFLFRALKYDSVIFLEDDMILHKFYIAVLGGMLDQAEKRPNVGMVACYGARHTLDVDKQIMERNHCTTLDHNWAFGLTRNLYMRRSAIVDRYIEILRHTDYSLKDSRRGEIHVIHHEMGFKNNVSSQDMLKTMATNFLGGVNFNTHAVLGKYIGEVGLHSNAAFYAAHEYQKTQMYPDDGPRPEPIIPPTVDFAGLLSRQADRIGRIVS